MRRGCEQQHPDLPVTDGRKARCSWGLEENVVLEEGEGGFLVTKKNPCGRSRKRSRSARKCIDQKGWRRSVSSARSRTRKQNSFRASASQKSPLPAQSAFRVSSSSPPPPPTAVSCRHAAGLLDRLLAAVTLFIHVTMSSSPMSVASLVPCSPSFQDDNRG